MAKKSTLKKWPADKVERRKISELIPYARNPRTHSDKQISRIASSIREWGWTIPVLIDADNTIIAGHGRILAAQKLGLVEVPCMVAEGWTEAQMRAYVIADNKLTIEAGWDDGLLVGELEGLEALGFDITLTGFDEIPGVGEVCGLTDPDDVPEAPANPVTTPGDLWLLGGHRVLCGDSTKVSDVDFLLQDIMPDLCMTDPPYGVEWNYDQHKDTHEALIKLINGFYPVAAQKCKVVALTPGIKNIWLYPQPDWMLCWFYAAGTGVSKWGFTAWQPFMVYGGDPKLAHGEGCHPDGFQFMMSRGDALENRGLNHACPKPLSVWRRFMERLTHKKSEYVYDPFCGSGTTVIAAEQLGLKCQGIEISPQYCDVIISRWEQFTGKHATLGGDGGTFTEIAEARNASG